MNFRNIQPESLLFMTSDELFLRNIARARAVVQGDVQANLHGPPQLESLGGGRRRDGLNASDNIRSRWPHVRRGAVGSAPEDSWASARAPMNAWTQARTLNTISTL